MSDSAQQVAAMIATLEDDIVFGRLAPWQELLEDELIARFETKRHAVRATIVALVERGLVVKPPNKTARVKDLDVQEVQWIYQIRMLLSASAVDLMPSVVACEDLAVLQQAQSAYVAAIQQGLPRVIRLANDKFHDLLFDLTPNRLLAQEVRRYTRLTDPIRSTGIVDSKWLKQAVLDHNAMMKALEVHDLAELKRLVLAHMVPVRDRWLISRRARVVSA